MKNQSQFLAPLILCENPTNKPKKIQYWNCGNDIPERNMIERTRISHNIVCIEPNDAISWSVQSSLMQKNADIAIRFIPSISNDIIEKPFLDSIHVIDLFNRPMSIENTHQFFSKIVKPSTTKANISVSEEDDTIINGKDADQIIELLHNPPKDSERENILKKVREKFPNPNIPIELDIDIPDE